MRAERIARRESGGTTYTSRTQRIASDTHRRCGKSGGRASRSLRSAEVWRGMVPHAARSSLRRPALRRRAHFFTTLRFTRLALWMYCLSVPEVIISVTKTICFVSGRSKYAKKVRMCCAQDGIKRLPTKRRRTAPRSGGYRRTVYACARHLVRKRLENVDLRVDLGLLCLADALHVHLAPRNLNALLLVVTLENCLERAVTQLLVELPSSAARRATEQAVDTEGMQSVQQLNRDVASPDDVASHPAVATVRAALNDRV